MNICEKHGPSPRYADLPLAKLDGFFGLKTSFYDPIAEGPEKIRTRCGSWFTIQGKGFCSAIGSAGNLIFNSGARITAVNCALIFTGHGPITDAR